MNLTPTCLVDYDTFSAIGPRGQRVYLTPIEFRLLARLAARPGVVVSHAALIAAAWGEDIHVPESYDCTLRTHIHAVRRKLAQAGWPRTLVETRPGLGWSVALTPSSRDLVAASTAPHAASDRLS